MINLFIDTNIFLNFFAYSSEDLNKLNNLHKLISETNQINLFIPKHLTDEFARNREKKINEAMIKFGDSYKKIEIPKICSGYEEVLQINRASQTIDKAKKN